MIVFDWSNLTYWSIGHIASIILPIIFVFVCFLILRLQTPKAQRAIILTIMIINVIQHIFKAYVYYPMYHGKFDVAYSFFCNICGGFILLSPLIFIGKSKWLKDSIFFLGILAPFVSLGFITVEYGISIFSVEYLRYFICHTLLLTTSALPVLLGLQTINIKSCWFVAFVFFFVEGLVFADEILITASRHNWNWNEAYQLVYNHNRLFICHPATSKVFDHTFLEGLQIKYIIDDGTYTYIPIIYSAPFIYPFMVIVSWVLFKLCYYTKIDGYYLAEKINEYYETNIYN